MSNNDEFIWAQKYRPSSIDECIIPPSIKSELKNYIKSGEIPHFLLCSESPGTGKTTVALALCDDIKCDYLFLNASLQNSINDLRYTVSQFVSTVSLNGGNKVVILDEADNLSQDAQKALRGMMEEYSHNARFILTCNNKKSIFNPIASRCVVIEFTFSKKDKKHCAMGMFHRCEQILTAEDIVFDRGTVAKIVEKYVPDNRTILNKLQSYANKYGKIDKDVLVELSKADTSELFDAMKSKKFVDIRDWVYENSSILSGNFYSDFYKDCMGKVPVSSEPHIIYAAATYQTSHNQAANIEINILGFLMDMVLNEVDFG